MQKSSRQKQIILIVAIVSLAGFLYTRDVKGLVKPEEETSQENSGSAMTAASAFSIEEASATGKNLIGSSSAKEITSLEGTFKSASGKSRMVIAQQLAQKWDDVEQAIPSAMYLEVVAEEDPKLENWLQAGNRFLKAFDNTQDSLVQPVMLQKANQTFTKALAIDSSNLEAKTGMGITIVNGMGAPMSGIAMLMEVVKEDPRNLKANMHLGLFAMKSGQFDKAIIRFNDIVAHIKATPDAYFYLASSYENLGRNKEAIDAYLNSKRLAANPTLSKFIDRKVEELKNKAN